MCKSFASCARQITMPAPHHSICVCQTLFLIRDGNRTKPKPNTPNSNTILRPFRTKPNEPKDFDNRTRTEPKHQVERAEPNPNLHCSFRFPSLFLMQNQQCQSTEGKVIRKTGKIICYIWLKCFSIHYGLFFTKTSRD